MSLAKRKPVKVAVLDLYNGVANQGMRCIREILNLFGEEHHIDLSWDEFDVRGKNEIPDLSYDMFISSGGPGSPFDGEGQLWEEQYFNWLQQVLDWNQKEEAEHKKHVFFICHSFQIACRYFNVGTVSKRKSTAFGVFPVHLMQTLVTEPVFDGLKDPFYAVDSRDYQVIQPDIKDLTQRGIRLLCIEKDRPHVPYERAIMAVRFNEYMIGTQFHPEADAPGMSMYLQTDEKKKTVIDNHGFDKWQSMIEHLGDPDKIMWTYAHILPNFLFRAVFAPVPETV
ncbi:homoserine O-succinyltransferase [Lacibacter sp. MH-610]|uniref:type 1 glutamine amidotransferase n=1 Tax=Lacibacter sp. MH-610 TaxID=3020883 RepID=UPI00389148BF